MKDLFIIPFIIVLCSCHNPPKSDIMVWNYDDFISKDIKMSDIADEMTIIQPDSIDYRGGKIVHSDSFFLVGTEQGILKYNREGRLIGRIGSIGQGPGEYNGIYDMAINEADQIIYVYGNQTSKLLSFSYDGTFLSEHTLQLPEEFASNFYCLKDRLYFYYKVIAGESEPYIYAITDTVGNLLSSKRDESLHFVPGNYYSFPLLHLGCLDDTMLVWNHYSDTIYRVSEQGEEPIAMWGQWSRRLTPSKVENNTIIHCMMIFTMVETVHYYLCIWRPFDFKATQWNYFFCDKSSGKLYNSQGITDDLWGLPTFIPYHYYKKDGREYLEASYQPYKLLDAWGASDDSKIRKQAESIDDEGNNVLIRIRLKEQFYK